MNINQYFKGTDERLNKLGKPVRYGALPPTTNKYSNSSPKDRAEAYEKVCRRLEPIEKGWLGGEYVKGGTEMALAMAKAQPIAYLDILGSIREMALRGESITKGFDVVPSPIAGLQAYDLEKPAKMLYPVVCPIRNLLPRVSGTGEAHNWRAILAVDDNNVGIGLGTGQRGAMINQRVAAFSAPYRSIGLENQATFEAQSASAGFEDILALTVLQTMQALMIREEQALIAGVGLPTEINATTYAFGQCATPGLVSSTSGGTLAAATYYVVAFALSLEGTTRVLPFTSGGASVLAQGNTTVTRTNIDGTTTVFNAGFGKLSAQASVTTTGAASSIAATVAAQPNVYGYIWGISTTSGGGAGYTVFGATNTNSVIITNNGTGNCVIPTDLVTNDRSGNAFMFDGLWTQALGALSASINPTSLGTSPYFTGTSSMINQTAPYFLTNYQSLNGAPLTSNGNIGVAQIDQMLQWCFDVYKFGPTKIFVSSSLQAAISNLVMQGPSAGASIVRVSGDLNSGGQAGIEANRVVTSYRNPFNSELMDIAVHPYLPPGVGLMYTERLPYPLTNVGPLALVRARRDYYAQEWPLRNRAYQYGVYSEQLVETYFPPGFQAIGNIGTPAFAPSVTMPTQALPANYI
jgi:hypothetical protein